MLNKIERFIEQEKKLTKEIFLNLKELDKNVVHGSDSDESAERELNLFFS